jgi:hypothetical protein
LDERHEKFYLYDIDFEYNGENVKYEINKEYIIDYNRDKIYVFTIDDIEWTRDYPDNILPYINIKPFSHWANNNEKINVKATITYSFDGGEVEYQYIDYLASKWTRMNWFSPLGFILLLFIPVG